MRALAELQGDSHEQREARRKKEADFRRLLDEQRRRDERRKKKEADEKRKLDEKDAAELLAAQRKYHAETVKKSGVRRVSLPPDDKGEGADDAEPGPPPAEPEDEKEATFRDRDKLPRTRGAPKPWTRGAPRAATPHDDLEDSGGLEPAIPGIGRGSRGSRPSTYDNYSDDDEPPPRKRSTHDSTADLEGMYREMLREQRMLRERVEELARTSREEVRLKRRDRRRPTPDSARPSTTGTVEPPPPKRHGPPPDTWKPRRAGRRSGTAPDDHEFGPRRGVGRHAAAGAEWRHKGEPSRDEVGRHISPKKDPRVATAQRPPDVPTTPQAGAGRPLKPPPILEARQTDAPEEYVVGGAHPAAALYPGMMTTAGCRCRATTTRCCSRKRASRRRAACSGAPSSSPPPACGRRAVCFLPLLGGRRDHSSYDGTSTGQPPAPRSSLRERGRPAWRVAAARMGSRF